MVKSYIDKDTYFAPEWTSFALGEAPSAYTLYASVNALSVEMAKIQWEEAAGNIPEGWKAVSDSIPADTQHYVYDNIPGTVFHLVGLGDDERIIILH